MNMSFIQPAETVYVNCSIETCAIEMIALSHAMLALSDFHE